MAKRKPTSIVWNYFELKNANIYKCKFCNQEMVKNSTRMKEHILFSKSCLPTNAAKENIKKESLTSTSSIFKRRGWY